MPQLSTGLSDDEVALVCRPKRAMRMLDVSAPTFYQLIKDGLIESYKQGAARKVVVASLHKYIAARIAANTSKKRQNQPGDPQREGAKV